MIKQSKLSQMVKNLVNVIHFFNESICDSTHIACISSNMCKSLGYVYICIYAYICKRFLIVDLFQAEMFLFIYLIMMWFGMEWDD